MASPSTTSERHLGKRVGSKQTSTLEYMGYRDCEGSFKEGDALPVRNPKILAHDFVRSATHSDFCEVKDAEQLKHELAAMNEMSGPVFKVTNDPRITPLGRILRKYSFD